MEEKKNEKKGDKKQTGHAWKGAWERPMKVDEESLDPLTVARMTDHNVRGGTLPAQGEEANESDQVGEKKKAGTG